MLGCSVVLLHHRYPQGRWAAGFSRAGGVQRARPGPLAAGHPALPQPVLVDLLTDDDPQVAEAAAANPSLPPAVMAVLLPQP